jgi:negative regulator of flagellin synthesis FlgM
MRVSDSNARPVQAGESSEARKTGKAAHAKKSHGTEHSEHAAESSARAEISARGKEQAKANATAKAAPDVREDRIAELRKRIESGHYKVDANAIADKMVDEHLSMGGAGLGD